MRKVFEDTTGRHAIWRGKITKIYLQWKARQKILTTKKKTARIKTTVIVSQKTDRNAPFLIEPIEAKITSPKLNKGNQNNTIQFEEIDEFSDASEFEEFSDLEWTPEINLSVKKPKKSSSKTDLLEQNLMFALDEIKESFVRHCPKCSGEMKNSFVILGPTRRMMVYQCALCKFYLPR